jgi:hypothetical protein
VKDHRAPIKPMIQSRLLSIKQFAHYDIELRFNLILNSDGAIFHGGAPIGEPFTVSLVIAASKLISTLVH